MKDVVMKEEIKEETKAFGDVFVFFLLIIVFLFLAGTVKRPSEGVVKSETYQIETVRQ